jgi:alkyl sulfatase BDS1-like metallo-beta-lactamase superfamily hydrolase
MNPKLVIKKETDDISNILIKETFSQINKDKYESLSHEEKKIMENKRIVNFKLSTEEENFNTKKQNSSFVNQSYSQINKQSSITLKDFKRRKSLFKEIECEIKQSSNENKELEFLSDYKKLLLEPEDEKYTQFIYTKIQIDEFCSLIMNVAGR